jgi:hypothetical protein
LIVRVLAIGVIEEGVVVMEKVWVPPGVIVAGKVVLPKEMELPDKVIELIIRFSAPVFSNLSE